MDRLIDRIKSEIKGIRGRVGVYVRDVRSSEERGIDEFELFPMASVCKMPILVTAMRMHDKGLLDLNTREIFTSEHRTMGSGLLSAFDEGIAPTIRDLLLLMITVSDNAATDIVLQRVGTQCITHSMHILGLNSISVNRSLQGQIDAIYLALSDRFAGMKFGDYEKLLDTHPDLRKIVEDPKAVIDAVKKAFENQDVGSPRDLGLLMESIAKDECASGDSCKSIIDILGRQCLNTRLPRYIPPANKVLHKTGTFGNGAVVNDIGLICKGVTPFASVAVLASQVENPMPETDEMIGQIGKLVFETLS